MAQTLRRVSIIPVYNMIYLEKREKMEDYIGQILGDQVLAASRGYSIKKLRFSANFRDFQPKTAFSWQKWSRTVKTTSFVQNIIIYACIVSLGKPSCQIIAANSPNSTKISLRNYETATKIWHLPLRSIWKKLFFGSIYN